VNRRIFRGVRQKKNNCHISVPVTLIHDLLASKLLCQVLLTRLASTESLNVVRCFVFELTVGTEQLDRRTEASRGLSATAELLVGL